MRLDECPGLSIQGLSQGGRDEGQVSRDPGYSQAAQSAPAQSSAGGEGGLSPEQLFLLSQ